MRTLAILSNLLLFASIGSAADEPKAKKGLVVHEWGVFRIHVDAEYANADVRAEWDALPEFFYGYIKGRVVPQSWGILETRFQPVIFFHAPEPTQATVTIDFPGGQAGMWYPATITPSVMQFQKQPKTGNKLVWDLGIKSFALGLQTARQKPLMELPADHWVNRVRRVNADPIFARFGPNSLPNALEVEKDNFLFYDGIFPQGKWLKIDVSKENVTLSNQVKHAVYDITIVDRRDDKIRVGRLAKLDAGEKVAKVEFVEVAESKFLSEATETLLKQLTAAGLFEAEARSLIDLQKAKFFETPGLNMFYRIPQSAYDASMPLTINPKAESIVRVGLIYHTHLEPDFKDSILELIEQLDSPKFPVRDGALKKLHQIGPAAFVEVQRLKDRKDLSVEVREKINGLLKKWNVKDAFDK